MLESYGCDHNGEAIISERNKSPTGMSVCHSFCLSATSELNISETRPDSGMVPTESLYKLAYGLSIGRGPDDVT